MSNQLGKITPRKIPADQAIAGNAEHARLIANRKKENKADGRPSSSLSSWHKHVKTKIFWPFILGLLVIIAFMGFFGVWAVSAPLSSAAIVSGIVTAKGQNLTVQHFEGGIIKNILVREGDHIEKGQPLIELDETDALATHARLTNSIIALQARIERLQAEKDNSDLTFTQELIEKAKKAGLETTLQEQTQEFEKRRIRYQTDAKIIDQQINALDQQVTGLNIQARSTEDQLNVLEEEIAAKNKLLKRKLTSKSSLLVLKRNYSELEGRLGRLTSAIGEARASMLQAENRKSQLQTERSEQAAASLNAVRREYSDYSENIRSTEKALNRVIIRAPSDGVIVHLNKNTPGSVVRPGEDLATILPVGGELIVEAELNPLDIDAVRVGQNARLRFSALNNRTTPEVEGKVIYIAADSQMNKTTGNPYYTARLSISKKLPDSIKASQIFPGMPVEVYINIGTRTFAQYIAKPLTDSFARAFTEE